MSSLLLKTPPLGLYIHLPWCVRKCPYCDFNSQARPTDPNAFTAYVEALIKELDLTCELLEAQELKLLTNRPIRSVYFGGGTPSLFPPQELERLFEALNLKLNLAADCEISMEANPGTVDLTSLKGYKALGVNRISLGIQSLNDGELKRLKRIHNRATALKAINDVASIFNNFNLDLMHSLPGQTTEMALADLSAALAIKPPHLSWYQLTIEEDTAFGAQTPLDLPSEDTIENTVVQGFKMLEESSYKHYEVSAFAQPNHECRHNVNYWRFGDYLALGAGAHSKFTLPDGIVRTSRVASPKAYMDGILKDSAPGVERGSLQKSALDLVNTSAFNLASVWAGTSHVRTWVEDCHVVPKEDLSFEYFLNRLRLFEAVPLAEFTAYTGLEMTKVMASLKKCVAEGLLNLEQDTLAITPKGHLFVNAMLEEFL